MLFFPGPVSITVTLVRVARPGIVRDDGGPAELVTPTQTQSPLHDLASCLFLQPRSGCISAVPFHSAHNRCQCARLARPHSTPSGVCCVCKTRNRICAPAHRSPWDRRESARLGESLDGAAPRLVLWEYCGCVRCLPLHLIRQY